MNDIFYGGDGSSAAWSERAFPKPSIHSFSFAVTPLEILALDGERFTHGTAFIYRVGGEIYLVTAWHVVSGRNFFTRQLNPDALVPSQFRLFVPGFAQTGEVLNIQSRPFVVDLTTAATEVLEAPPMVQGMPVDLAVAKLPMATETDGLFTSRGLNEFEWGFPERKRPPIQSMVGADLYVLGYPLKTYEGLRTPIWKRGSLASEPGFRIVPPGAFLLDIASSSGMSGGPIVRRVTSFVADNKDEGVIQERYDEAVIGIYSGRALLPSQPHFVLGYGWPIDLVHEIITTGQCFSGG